MGGSDWRPLRGIDQRRLSMARLQAHHAVQWLARTARAYVPPQPDDGHMNFGWNDALDGFATHRMQGGMCLSLKIACLTLVLHCDESTIQSFSLDRRTDAQARQWLGEQVGARGLDAHALDAPSLYEMPEHAVTHGATYDIEDLADALVELAVWYANAEFLLAHVQRQIIGRRLTASDVRCWPHHFDLATLISFSTRELTSPATSVRGFLPETSIMTSPISMYRFILDPTARRCHDCRSSAIGIRTSSRQQLHPRIRLLRRIIKKTRLMNS